MTLETPYHFLPGEAHFPLARVYIRDFHITNSIVNKIVSSFVPISSLTSSKQVGQIYFQLVILERYLDMS